MKILIAIDESPISLRAAQEAAKLFPSAEFVVVNVNHRPVPWVSTPGFGFVYPVTVEQFPVQGLSPDELAERASEAGLDDAEVIALESLDAATAICEAAEANDVAAVVVGSHNRGLLRRLLNPSLADEVVRGTHRPVVVVSGAVPGEQTGEA
ncbi:MAG: universal stress protein [Ilumatobacteraceae bacterium]